MERVRGGGYCDYGMALAAGGLIKQTIIKDRYNADSWDTEAATVFNVQILSSAAFQKVTGGAPPATPVTAKAYAEHGFPYYDIFNEKASGIHGAFGGVRSLNEMGKERSAFWDNLAAAAEVEMSTDDPVVLLDGEGKVWDFARSRLWRRRFVTCSREGERLPLRWVLGWS